MVFNVLLYSKCLVNIHLCRICCKSLHVWQRRLYVLCLIYTHFPTKWHTYVHSYLCTYIPMWMCLIEYYHTCTCLRMTYVHMDIGKIRTIVLFIPSPQAHLYTYMYVQRKTACTRATTYVHRLHISCIVILRLVPCTMKDLTHAHSCKHTIFMCLMFVN